MIVTEFAKKDLHSQERKAVEKSCEVKYFTTLGPEKATVHLTVILVRGQIKKTELNKCINYIIHLLIVSITSRFFVGIP